MTARKFQRVQAQMYRFACKYCRRFVTLAISTSTDLTTQTGSWENLRKRPRRHNRPCRSLEQEKRRGEANYPLIQAAPKSGSEAGSRLTSDGFENPRPGE